MPRKNILIVTRNLPPLIGGMERLNWHIADELSHDHDILLLSHNDAKERAPKNCKFFGVRLNPLALFLVLAFFKALLLCLRHKPDILFAGSGLTAPIVVFLGKIFRIKSVVYIHGLDINNSSQIYQKLWLPFIRQANQIIANSTPTKNLAIQQNIDVNKIKIIHPGVSFPPPSKDFNLIESLKDRFDLHDRKILLSVGRLTERKGILEFVQHCLPLIVSAEPNTKLVVIGDTAAHALNNKFQTQEQILKIAEQYDVKDNILFTGSINDNELSQFYYLADIHVFPVKDIPDDPEGFGMVAIEAAAHGTPTVAFATGGIIDAIENSISGHLIDCDNYAKFSDCVVNVLTNNAYIENDCKAFASQFSWTNLSNKMNKIIKTVNDPIDF